MVKKKPDEITVTVSKTFTTEKGKPDKPPGKPDKPDKPTEPPIEPPEPLGEITVTAPNGQWWRLSGVGLLGGTYVNGDPWVQTAPDTTVEVIALSHMPTGTGAGARNGGMINPDFNDLEESEPLGNQMIVSMKQGYDGRAVQPLNVMDYDESRNAHAVLLTGGVITLKPGDSLVSAESWIPDTEITNNNSCVIARMACLTIVDYTPEIDEFRPNYFGTAKRRYRFRDADLSLLPDLVAPYNPKGAHFEGFHIDEASVYVGADAGDPYPTQVQQMEINAIRHLQYWVYPYGGLSSVPLLKPVFQQAWYPRDNGTAFGQLSMYVMCNFEDRDKHLISLLQLAIDAYAIAEGDGFVGGPPFAGGAGFFASPLWQIRLAGLLFGDEAMKNAVNIPTGNVDIYGNPCTKWGEINRVYYSTSAHEQYRMPEGYDISKGKPLYGDMPNLNVEHGQPSNGTVRDPQAVYDAHAYKWGLPTANYPNILDDSYEMMLIDGVECQNLGTYMNMTSSMMGSVLSSMAMGDEDFWGGAVVDFAKRHANDPQMWGSFGREFDYSNAFQNTFRRDIEGHGGSGSGFMCQLWDTVMGKTP